MSTSGITCSSCGARNEKDDRFCKRCGSEMGPAPSPHGLPEPVFAPSRATGSLRGNLPLLVTMGLVSALLIAVLFEVVIILYPLGMVQEVGATLSVLEGKALVQRDGEGDWHEATDGYIVRGGDRIRVLGSSRVLLTFLEGTDTELRPYTEVTVAELELAAGQPVVVRLDLHLGEMWNRIGDLPADSLHEIRTAAATVIGRRSEYGIAANEAGTTWLAGREGEIDVTGRGQTVQLRAGDTLVVEPGLPPVAYEEPPMAPPAPTKEPIPVVHTLVGIDLPTFLNEPLPTGTPTNTATAAREPGPTPTPTGTATPTATATRTSCPTLVISAPHLAYPRRVFGMEWDVRDAAIPSGWQFVFEFSGDPSPQAVWQRSQPDRVYEEHGHWKADLHGPGEGNWYWRVCLVADPTGPVQLECCSEAHLIVHQRDEPEEPDQRDEYDIYGASVPRDSVPGVPLGEPLVS
ncbi:MAG: hypothetical protein GTO63_16500 [Anaerolineae bacterium]|nr:hypothetical protein [Anaerolineae bacterium]NIN96414.1 hypothetical protein [Anaerolineae bacterium]NIQ79450.1 hypothetical protein [Anaerolineae bacterium]